MKRIFNIFISCTLLLALMGGAGVLTTSCTLEDKPGDEQTDDQDNTDTDETPSAPGAPAAFSKFISVISKGEKLQIPLEGICFTRDSRQATESPSLWSMTPL